MKLYAGYVGFFIAATALTALPGTASACTGGVEGEALYNDSEQVLQYCDGTNWIAMHAAGSGSGGCTSPTADEGEVIYNESVGVPQVCAGNVWRLVKANDAGLVRGPDWETITIGPHPSPALSSGDKFGYSVDISGDYIIASARAKEVVYVIDANTGNVVTTLNNPGSGGRLAIL